MHSAFNANNNNFILFFACKQPLAIVIIKKHFLDLQCLTRLGANFENEPWTLGGHYGLLTPKLMVPFNIARCIAPYRTIINWIYLIHFACCRHCGQHKFRRRSLSLNSRNASKGSQGFWQLCHFDSLLGQLSKVLH